MKKFVNPMMNVVSFETEEAVTVSLVKIYDEADNAAPTKDFSSIVVDTFFDM